MVSHRMVSDEPQDVTVRRGDEVVAEFRGRARTAGQLGNRRASTVQASTGE